MDALAWQACDMVNIKPGRVGGVDVARTVHDLCVVAGVPAVIGGMLETGVGRAVNVALASLPGFTEAGDLSASDRYFAEDITEPFVLDGGQLTVPAGPGIGVTPRPEMLRRYTVAARDADAALIRRRCYCGRAPDEDDRVLGCIGIEPHQDRIRERRLARVLLHDRDLFVARALERVRDAEETGREHGAGRGLLELVDAALLGRRVFVVVVHHAPPRVTPLAGTQVATGSSPAAPSTARPTHGVRRRRQVGERPARRRAPAPHAGAPSRDPSPCRTPP